MPRVVVIGGGISGLSAAHFLSRHMDPGEITLFDADSRFGGVIRSSDFGSSKVETGPDSFITRNKAALDLATELGLINELISPATNKAQIFHGGRLHPIPKGTVFGAPSDFTEFLSSSLISPAGKLRASLEPLLPKVRLTDDMTVGAFARKRWGAEVTRNLIDPLVGGIHAGSAFELSLAKCAPQYLEAARASRSVSRALNQTKTAMPGSATPAFYSFERGLTQLINALELRLSESGILLHKGAKCLSVEKAGTRFVLTTESSNSDTHRTECDAVIVATRAFQAANLLETITPVASHLLNQIGYASPAMTLLAYPEDAFDARLNGSGLLVPKTQELLTTAVTFGSNKWPTWKTEGEVVLRVSTGRYRDKRAERFSDEGLVANLEAEMRTILGAKTGSLRSQVHRWPQSLPQFRPFHQNLIERIRNCLPDGIVLAGSPYLGVGIPACISSARAAAETLREHLAKLR